jgi:AcrR family transcriptional regulator
MSAPETPRLLALALDPTVQTDDDNMSQRILDAALELSAASGLRHLTMDDVARKANVGRMTVYRRFATKSALVDALAVRECRHCLAVIADAIDPDDGVVDRIAAMFVAVLRVIREHPLLERLARVEPEALLSELTRDRSRVFRLVREFLIDRIHQAQEAGELAEADAAVLAELALRLGASFVLMPDSVLALDDEAATRATVRALLAPVLQPA